MAVPWPETLPSPLRLMLQEAGRFAEPAQGGRDSSRTAASSSASPLLLNSRLIKSIPPPRGTRLEAGITPPGQAGQVAGQEGDGPRVGRHIVALQPGAQRGGTHPGRRTLRFRLMTHRSIRWSARRVVQRTQLISEPCRLAAVLLRHLSTPGSGRDTDRKTAT